MNKKQVSINMVASAFSAVVTLAVSFFLTPYLTQMLGDEAYGYINLASSFTTYGALFTTALNSMAGRYIMIAMQKDGEREVDEYYSSLLAAGGILGAVFFAAGIVLATRAEYIFKITPELLPGVRITFFLAALNYVVITVFTVFSISPFIKNRLDLQAWGTIAANLCKAVFLFLIFSLCAPKMFFSGLGGLLYTVVLYGTYIGLTVRLLPELRLKLRFVRVAKIRRLVASGIWNSTQTITYLMMVGADLMLANWLLGEKAMGLISICSTMTVASNSILAAVTGAFKPSLTHCYAEGDREKLRRDILHSNRVQCIVMFVPIAGLCIFGSKFYALWMPYRGAEEIKLLALLTALKVLEQFAEITIDAIQYNFTIYDRLKKPSCFRLGIAALNIPLVVLLAGHTGNRTLQLCIIAGLSTLLYMLYYWGVIPRLACQITGESGHAYAKEILTDVALFGMVCAIFIGMDRLFAAPNWAAMIVLVAAAAVVGYGLLFLFGLSRKEKADAGRLLKQMLRHDRTH